MVSDAEMPPQSRKRLIVHDSLALLAMIAVTLVLFAVTLLLFRSFTTHRSDLAHRWADRGQAALLAGQPAQAIEAYRAALSYAPGEPSYDLMLARALADAGRTDEAFNYFTELWELHPGDGFINLQLARLAAKKLETQDAINFYRASLYGTWEGDGVERRRGVRLELARFLIAQKQYSSARVELLVAGGNAPDSTSLDLVLAGLLEQVQAPNDALDFYRKALGHEPRNPEALAGAGRLSFVAGDYAIASRLLDRAAREAPGNPGIAAQLVEARRILQLMPSDSLSDAERTAHILALRAIAKSRLLACSATLSPDDALRKRWSSPAGTSSRAAVLRDRDKQTAAVQLAYDTALATEKVGTSACPPPTRDDTLLLLLAHASALEEASHP